MKATESTYKELRTKLIPSDPKQEYVTGVVYTKWGYIDLQMVLIHGKYTKKDYGMWKIVAFETNIAKLCPDRLMWYLNYCKDE